MYNEWFSYMNKPLRNDISFSIKIQMVLEKIYLYLSLPNFSDIST